MINAFIDSMRSYPLNWGIILEAILLVSLGLYASLKEDIAWKLFLIMATAGTAFIAIFVALTYFVFNTPHSGEFFTIVFIIMAVIAAALEQYSKYKRKVKESRDGTP